MRLYEVNAEFARIVNACEWDNDRQAWVDMDTGEIMTDEQFHDALMALDGERDRILEYCVKTYLDEEAKAAMCDTEIKRLQALKKYHEKRADRLKAVIDREQDGKPRDFGFAKVSYRTSKPVTWESEDEQKIIAWLLSNNHYECVKQSFEIRKTELGKLIDKGEGVTKWARKDEKKNMSIK